MHVYVLHAPCVKFRSQTSTHRFFNRKNKGDGDVVQNRSETVTVSQGSFSPNPQKMVLGVILGIFVLNFDFLGGGLKHFLFSPLPGEMIQID